MRNGRALLAAMGWASSLVSSLAAERRPRLLIEIDVRERLPAGVADDEGGRLGSGAGKAGLNAPAPLPAGSELH